MHTCKLIKGSKIKKIFVYFLIYFTTLINLIKCESTVSILLVIYRARSVVHRTTNIKFRINWDEFIRSSGTVNGFQDALNPVDR